jgi:hypothetical protein
VKTLKIISTLETRDIAVDSVHPSMDLNGLLLENLTKNRLFFQEAISLVLCEQNMVRVRAV